MQFTIDRAAVQCKLKAVTQQEVFERMAAPLLAAGHVKPEFAEFVGRREQDFPTGLPLGDVAIAIPHTDPEHVNDAAVSIATLEHPIEFHVMGSPDQTCQVSLLFMLALTGGHQHLELLQQIVGVAQNRKDLDSLLDAKDSDELFANVERLFLS